MIGSRTGKEKSFGLKQDDPARAPGTTLRGCDAMDEPSSAALWYHFRALAASGRMPTTPRRPNTSASNVSPSASAAFALPVSAAR